jgi:WD40 repeat protein
MSLDHVLLLPKLTLLQGAPAGFEQMLTKCAWSKTDNGARVAAGGGDRTVTIWDVESGKILYKLGGHKGSVGAVDFHPREPISECCTVSWRCLLTSHVQF